jgi:hypothetical protein
MANEFEPRVDQWYSLRGKEEMFRVVAVDDGAIEIQSFDGAIEELDPDAWRDLDIEPAESRENWTGPVRQCRNRRSRRYAERDAQGGRACTARAGVSPE